MPAACILSSYDGSDDPPSPSLKTLPWKIKSDGNCSPISCAVDHGFNHSRQRLISSNHREYDGMIWSPRSMLDIRLACVAPCLHRSDESLPFTEECLARVFLKLFHLLRKWLLSQAFTFSASLVNSFQLFRLQVPRWGSSQWASRHERDRPITPYHSNSYDPLRSSQEGRLVGGQWVDKNGSSIQGHGS